MATLAPGIDRASLFGDAPREPERPTLDALVSGAWRAVADERAAPCPLCGGGLVPRFGAGARPVGARCADCRTELT